MVNLPEVATLDKHHGIHISLDPYAMDLPTDYSKYYLTEYPYGLVQFSRAKIYSINCHSLTPF